MLRLLLAFIIFPSLAIAKPSADSKSLRLTERVQLSLEDKSSYHAILSIPKKPSSPLPVLIVLGGFDTGEKSVQQLPDDVEMIYATVDYPYKAPNQRSFVRDLKQIPEVKKAIHRVDLLIDALIAQLKLDPRVDQTKMTFAGASFGAPFAITAAVRNPEIDAVVLIHAFGDVGSAITQQLVNEWGWWSKPIAFVLGHLAWNYLNYKEPEAEVLKLHPHQHVLNLYAADDEQLPAVSITSLQTALTKSPAQVTTRDAPEDISGQEKKKFSSQ